MHKEYRKTSAGGEGITLEEKLKRLSERYRHEIAEPEERLETLHELRKLEKKLGRS